MYNKEAAKDKLRDVDFKTENTNFFIYLKSEEEDEWNMEEKIKISMTDGEWSCIAVLVEIQKKEVKFLLSRVVQVPITENKMKEGFW